MPYKNKTLQQEYQREWTKTKRTALRAAFFSDKSCKQCGCAENLELHHIDPRNKISHRFWLWLEEKRRDEISKCVVLCKTCHQKLHSEQRKRFVHGLSSTYRKGCRCEDCRQAQYRTMKRKPALET
jgi:hypothetical protein